MTDPTPKPDRTEMWKALKWTIILLITLIAAFGVFKIWHVATAPARAVSDATSSVKASASAMMNRLEVPVRNERLFNKIADESFEYLNSMPEKPPAGVKDRGFRLANLRGAQDRVCEMSHDFGNGDVPVYLSADNAAHESANAVGSNADRLIRVVVVSPEQTLGLNVEYDQDADNWTLGWRPSSVNKPYPDDWAEGPMTEILARAPKSCGA
jgi:hypothetical protein